VKYNYSAPDWLTLPQSPMLPPPVTAKHRMTLVNPGGVVHARNVFVTNWPITQVVQMYKKLSASPTDQTRRYKFSLGAHHMPPNSDPGSASAEWATFQEMILRKG